MVSTVPAKTVMSYARARLFLGASAVGTVTVLTLIALALDAPGALTRATSAFGDGIAAVALLLVIHGAVMLPFDLFGGWLLPREYGRSREPLARFLVRWGRGAFLYALSLVVAAAVLLIAARWGGAWAAVAAFVALNTLQLVAQPWLAAAIGSLTLRIPRAAAASADLGPRTRVVAGDCPHFTGGAYGLPGRGAWVVPQRWSEATHALDPLALRERRGWLLASGARDRGVALAVAWNAVPLLVVLAWSGAPVTGGDLVQLALVSTLWSFVGVLSLPTPSRRAVYQADAAALRRGADPERFAADLRTLDADQDDEPSRSRAVESIFHPIPALERRLLALQTPSERPSTEASAWHAARMALYLSWSGVGLLGRSVHCNVGRPEVWVFLPCD